MAQSEYPCYHNFRLNTTLFDCSQKHQVKGKTKHNYRSPIPGSLPAADNCRKALRARAVQKRLPEGFVKIAPTPLYILVVHIAPAHVYTAIVTTNMYTYIS